MGQFGSVEIVGQNRLIVVALGTHNGCSNLAKSDTVSPACASKDEVAILVAIYYKGTAIQVALT